MLNMLLLPRPTAVIQLLSSFQTLISSQSYNTKQVPRMQLKMDACCITHLVCVSVCLSTTCGSAKASAEAGAGPGGWSARLRGDTPSKGPQWGSFVQLLSRVHPNPQEPPVTATGKWGMLKEVGVGSAVEWLIGFTEMKQKEWPLIRQYLLVLLCIPPSRPWELMIQRNGFIKNLSTSWSH